jgi:hypothetical protein
MKATLLAFGEIEVEGEYYDHDVVIRGGVVKKRKKKASKAYREEYGHTPLSIAENLPWGGKQLVVGTGVYGRLPIMPEVDAEARRRGIELIALSTPEACARLSAIKRADVYAVLHVTC